MAPILALLLAAAALAAIAEDQQLGPRDPLKVGAYVRLASLRMLAGDLAGARAAYQQSGLTSQECALVDVQPALTKTGLGSEDFPREAEEWGFAGWVHTEFDIDADGRTTNVRAIVAYPPFVFAAAAVKGLQQTRYQQSYRPEGGPGCSGREQGIRFILRRQN